MSGSSENDSSHRSGGASDCEGSAASSHESELPDTRTPLRNEQIRGKAWILRGEITTDLLHNDSASMDCDDDQDAKVQNTKSQTEAALGATFANGHIMFEPWPMVTLCSKHKNDPSKG